MSNGGPDLWHSGELRHFYAGFSFEVTEWSLHVIRLLTVMQAESKMPREFWVYWILKCMKFTK